MMNKKSQLKDNKSDRIPQLSIKLGNIFSLGSIFKSAISTMRVWINYYSKDYLDDDFHKDYMLQPQITDFSLATGKDVFFHSKNKYFTSN